MKATITHQVEVSSIQKATALRDKVNELLGEDEEVFVIDSHSAQDQPIFTVTGVDTKTKEPFTEQIEAEDEDDAKVQAETGDRVVARVQETQIGAVNE